MTAAWPSPPVDDWDYFDDDAAGSPGSRGGYRGPGSAGANWCACGWTISWPDGIPADERATGIRLFDEHVAECPVAHPELVQPAPTVAPSPTAVAVLHARHRAHLDALATDVVRRSLRMTERLRAAGLPPGPAARITAAYLETSVLMHPELRGWQR